MIQSETLELLEWPRLCQHLATFTATKLGAIAARLMQIPATKAETIQLLAQTQEVYRLEMRSTEGWYFDGIEDIGAALERSELGGILSGGELLDLATTLAGVRRLRRVIENYESDLSPGFSLSQEKSPNTLTVLTDLVSDLRTYPELEQEIHRCIDDRGDVSSRASVKLAGIREQIGKLRNRIEEILRGILQRKAIAIQQQLITQRGDRFVIPVKAPQKDAVPGIVHDTSTSGMTLYIEPHAIVNLNNEMRQLQRQEEREEEAIRRSLTEKVAEVKADLERLLAIATILDLATAKARYSFWLEASPPVFVVSPYEAKRQKQVSALIETESEKLPNITRPRKMSLGAIADAEGRKNELSEISLRRLRHPLLVWQHKHEEGPEVVPIDLTIEPYIRVVAITGPNTGGKTVTLKTLGLAALMAKVGLFVPAREPVQLPWFELILADIGDEQSIEQSLSTFSGHVRRISRIIEAIAQIPDGDITAQEESHQSTKKPALVLLDEIGAGTDPSEGTALAISLLQYLADRVLLTVATTHFGELKSLKYQDERFENASVEFDNVSLQPTYRLLWGIPGRSNALAIASRLGLALEIVENARNYVGTDSFNVDLVIEGLESERQQQEIKARETSELLQETERLHGEVSQRAAVLQERERELKLAQEKAVREAIAEAKAEIAQVIRRLQRGPQTGRNAQSATDALNEVAEKFLPSQEQPKRKPGFLPTVGDRIRIPRIGQTAEVLSGPNDNGELTVRFGIMKMNVDLSEIESLDGEKVEVIKKGQAVRGNNKKRQVSEAENSNSIPGALASSGEKPPTVAVRTAQNTIDLRGSRVSDAEIEIDRAISKAVEYGVLWIIHGKGTGKLRQGTHDFLERHSLVDRYELASQKEGGSGVTIAYLK